MSADPRTYSAMRRALRQIYNAAIAAVAPALLVERVLDGVVQGSERVPEIVAGAHRIFLLAAGKASLAMASALIGQFGTKVAEAITVLPDPGPGPDSDAHLEIYRAGHPIPNAVSQRAAQAVLEVAARARAGDLVVFALSGGASALLALAAPPLTLADKIAINRELLRAAAPIHEVNAVRKHLSAIKGGRLRQATGDAQVLTLVLSDVIGNDLATIGSGPTVADPSTYADAVSVLKRRRIWGRAPERVRGYLERGASGEIGETLKDDNPARSVTVIVGDNGTAVEGAVRAARSIGYDVRIWQGLGGDAEKAGRAAAAELGCAGGERICIVGGGEPVVNLRGSGRGGRAQHCALSLAIELDRLGPLGPLAALVAGTDGVDGPTDAAGAFVDEGTVARARRMGLDPQAALTRNDAYSFFEKLGDLLVTGPSGTNVSDLLIGLSGSAT